MHIKIWPNDQFCSLNTWLSLQNVKVQICQGTRFKLSDIRYRHFCQRYTKKAISLEVYENENIFKKN